eukprot:UN07528
MEKRMAYHLAYHTNDYNILIHCICIPLQYLGYVQILKCVLLFDDFDLAKFTIFAVSLLYCYIKLVPGLIP